MSMAYIGPDVNVLKTRLALANEMKHMKKEFLQTEALPNEQRANIKMCFTLFRQGPAFGYLYLNVVMRMDNLTAIKSTLEQYQ